MTEFKAYAVIRQSDTDQHDVLTYDPGSGHIGGVIAYTGMLSEVVLESDGATVWRHRFDPPQAVVMGMDEIDMVAVQIEGDAHASD